MKTFKAKPGQVDYTNIRYAPVLNCVARFNNRILLVKRSDDLRFYPGFWNGVSGFLDDKRDLRQKVEEELAEELGLKKSALRHVTFGQVFDQEAPEYGKTWIVHPVLVELNDDKIKIDWEANEYRWIDSKEISTLKLMPGFEQVLKNLNLI